jgi:hypothetical protein
MDEHVTKLLTGFAHVCTTATLEPDDWQRLYEVVLDAHERRVVPAPHIVKDFMIAQGCSHQKAGFLSNQYEHFCNILRLYDERKRPVS